MLSRVRIALLLALAVAGIALLVWQVTLAPEGDLAVAVAIAAVSLLLAVGLTVLAGVRERRPTEGKSRSPGDGWLLLGLFAIPFIGALPGFPRIAVLGTLAGVLIGSVIRAARVNFANPY